MDKLTARFVTTAKPAEYVKSMRLHDITLYQINLSEDVAQRVIEKADEYFVSVFNSYYYENDERGDVKKGELFGGFEIKNLLSAFSLSYYTDEPQVDILVDGGEFAGVVVLMRERSGSTWTTRYDDWFVIHRLDGTVEGKNRAENVVTTESNSKEDIKHYYLVKK